MNVLDRFRLDDQTIVITGAGGRLGASYCKAVVDAGGNVVALDLNTQSLVDGVATLPQEKVMTCTADVTDKRSLEVALESAISRFGAVHGLVNNAAIDAPPGAPSQSTGPFESYPAETFRQMMDVNVTGVVLCCQVFGASMANGCGGSIVNIDSIYGILSPDQRIYEGLARDGERFIKPVGYAVSKSALLNLTRYLATYWAPSGVRVNTLTLAGVFAGQDPSFLEAYTPKVPLGRMAHEDEYDGALVFLLSDSASYVTGSNLVADGGYSAW